MISSIFILPGIYIVKKSEIVMKKCIVVLLLLSICMEISGCSIKKSSDDKICDLEYTVVEDGEVPEELMDLIEKKKEEVFNLTFDNGECLYMVAGYGAQPTSGYSVFIREMYETDNAICVESGLKGPDKTEKVNDIVTYPYVVVKIEYTDKTVLFKK